MTPTNQSSGTTNASVEVLSEDGPMPINVMMQEGVKALTKILSNQLQGQTSFSKRSSCNAIRYKKWRKSFIKCTVRRAQRCSS
ncbi:ADM_collapsed_G0046790.mRNA.1.CDS.1 [Saccharomyces cerevisiae]|nr:ADM_collapsed_G0046790.mRNA.1.CDS.1 [Saccharomyces cerevisiae]